MRSRTNLRPGVEGCREVCREVCGKEFCGKRIPIVRMLAMARRFPELARPERKGRSKAPHPFHDSELRLNLRCVHRRRRRRCRLEADLRMRSIAERLVLRRTAAAQRNSWFTRQIPLPAIRIHQLDRTLNAKWTIRPHCDLYFVSLRFVLSHKTLLLK